MSELLQSGQHPDADQLSAFLEHALPSHEREQTLAHLAICPDCRAIVSLSLPPLEESPKPQAQPARKPWFSGWRVALPAAAAFATLVVIVHIRNTSSIKSSTTTTQIAVSQPSEPNMPLSSPLPATAETAESNAKTQQSFAVMTPQSSSHPGSKSPVISKPERNEPVAGPQLGIKPPSEGRNITQSAQSQQLQPNGFAPLHGAGSATNGAATSVQVPAVVALDRLPQSAPPAPQMSPASQSSATTLPLRQQAVAGAKPAPVAGDAVTAAATNQTVDVTSASPIATLASANNLAPNESKNIVAEHPLPSHLSTISTVSTAHQILALDTRNSLFLSDDGGQHWRAVSPQWHGRAVKVDLAPSSIRGQGYVAGTAPAAQVPANNSSVTGTVKDASGAVIPDASIAISDATTQIVRTVKTDHAGNYLVDNLTPGNYQIEAQAPGFNTQQLAVTLAGSQRDEVNLILPIGQASETVTVNAMAVSPAIQSLKRSKAAQPQSVSQTLPVFTITTDSGERWTSADGQTWKRQ